MSRLDAERIARLYDGFYAENPGVLEPIQDRDPSHTSPLQTLAGFAVLALVAVIFGVIL